VAVETLSMYLFMVRTMEFLKNLANLIWQRTPKSHDARTFRNARTVPECKVKIHIIKVTVGLSQSTKYGK
jgi:hypothetical protein